MKQETKNEMDLLLRRLGRRDEATVSNAADDHLDADELSAYAENALPAAARSRYTSHLAECSRCREIVAQLNPSVGVMSATEAVAVSEPSVWRRFLAGLFTPMVLRYAAPALGLIIVAVIGFVVLRRNQSPQYVTQLSDNDQRPAAIPAAEPTSSRSDNAGKTVPSPEGFSDRQTRNLQAETPRAENEPVVSDKKTEVAKDTTAQSKPDQQQTTANEAPPPAKAAPAPTPAERPATADTEVSKKDVKELPVASPASGTALQSAEREDRRSRGFVRGKATDEVSAQGTGSVSKLKRDELNVSANTRTVAGRRFSKKGGVWIDTAYDSSKDSVTLTRGSEQYRALVADEPEIKTIADTLDGEIIIVWKGHTYRIR